MQEKQTTFALIKPDSFVEGQVEDVLSMIRKAGFTVIRSKIVDKPLCSEVEAHLADLKGKNLNAYTRNYGFLLRGPVMPMVLTRQDDQDPVQTLRDLIGPTNPTDAPEGTIRALSPDDIHKAEAQNRGLANRIHASDSPESAETETNIWF